MYNKEYNKETVEEFFIIEDAQKMTKGSGTSALEHPNSSVRHSND